MSFHSLNPQGAGAPLKARRASQAQPPPTLSSSFRIQGTIAFKCSDILRSPSICIVCLQSCSGFALKMSYSFLTRHREKKQKLPALISERKAETRIPRALTTQCWLCLAPHASCSSAYTWFSRSEVCAEDSYNACLGHSGCAENGPLHPWAALLSGNVALLSKGTFPPKSFF